MSNNKLSSPTVTEKAVGPFHNREYLVIIRFPGKTPKIKTNKYIGNHDREMRKWGKTSKL